jgi:hypothetical protein
MFYADLANALNHGTPGSYRSRCRTEPSRLVHRCRREGLLALPADARRPLMPVVAIWGAGYTQLTFSLALGAVNVVLFLVYPASLM